MGLGLLQAQGITGFCISSNVSYSFTGALQIDLKCLHFKCDTNVFITTRVWLDRNLMDNRICNNKKKSELKQVNVSGPEHTARFTF